MTRAGIGYDLHRLAEGRKLITGGIEIEFHKGPVGHSDGDALAHAICDARSSAPRGLGISARIFRTPIRDGRMSRACDFSSASANCSQIKTSASHT